MDRGGVPLCVVIARKMCRALSGVDISAGKYASLLGQVVVGRVVNCHRCFGWPTATSEPQPLCLHYALGVRVLAVGLQGARVIEQATQTGRRINKSGGGEI